MQDLPDMEEMPQYSFRSGFVIDPKTGARMGGYDPKGNSIAIAW